MDKPVKLVLCWHMHQPYYRDELHGEYHLPWVYLHAMKDYTDMAWHLERHPRMRVVVNFTPVLLEQLLDYASRIRDFLDNGREMNDRQLNLLAGVLPIPADAQERRRIISDCQRCHAPTMINPWPAFRRLIEIAAPITGHGDGGASRDIPALAYLSDAYFHDLLVWYHLGWLGYSVRRREDVARLIEKGGGYSMDDRITLLRIIHECIDGIIPRYRALADRGQAELSMTPWGHPIIPLLHDFNNVDCSQPDALRPLAEGYPGGRERSRWHMQHGIELFERCFGHRPSGVWLSEGSISHGSLALLDEFDIQWTASGESVWHNSARLSRLDEETITSKRGLFHPYRYPDSDCRIFFRDDGLSDLVGFEYRDWDSRDAVTNLLTHLKNINHFLSKAKDEAVISIIMDGENAWEYYPDNGYHFLDRLYAALEKDPAVETVTFTEAVNLPAREMPSICPGSWVYGTFSTWIGEAGKNRAWDLLVDAKRDCDRVMANPAIDEAQRMHITRQLGICEGSDWFWWFGDYNPEHTVKDFDALFRHQLRRLYGLMELEPPPALDIPISHGSTVTRHDSGAMQRNA
ncbi:MAG: glycoside hydrolase family 57 protein [Gammaproteobacteria bacterium]